MSNQLPLHRHAINANIPYLDGIRGLAIFLVAAGHIFNEIYLFKITWVGLNLFFILSGYLITGCLFRYQSHSVTNYFRNFYGRRILRIFPLYYGALIFFFFVLIRVFFFVLGLIGVVTELAGAQAALGPLARPGAV